jgi:DNA repair exonuclease SbcCD ATPase subunit
MIELQTNPEYLDMLAADQILDGRDATGKDLKAAALDHKNLREYAETLERNIQKMSAEIQTHAEQRQQLADVLFDLLSDRIDQRIVRHVVEEIEEKTSDIIDRLDQLETDANSDDIRQEVRDMISDGEIVVSIDYC